MENPKGHLREGSPRVKLRDNRIVVGSRTPQRVGTGGNYQDMNQVHLSEACQLGQVGLQGLRGMLPAVQGMLLQELQGLQGLQGLHGLQGMLLQELRGMLLVAEGGILTVLLVAEGGILLVGEGMLPAGLQELQGMLLVAEGGIQMLHLRVDIHFVGDSQGNQSLGIETCELVKFD
jgi:hypothetical protein